MNFLSTILHAVLSFLDGGLFDLTMWQMVVYTLVVTHITIAGVTIYLHRCATHGALTLHPAIRWLFRFALWITTRVSGGMPAHTSGAGTAPAGAVVSWNLTEAPTGTAGNATGAALQCSVIRGNVTIVTWTMTTDGSKTASPDSPASHVF